MTSFADLIPNTPKGRYDGIKRPYTVTDVLKLRGSITQRHTLAEMGAARLWELLQGQSFTNALGAFPATKLCRWYGQA